MPHLVCPTCKVAFFSHNRKGVCPACNPFGAHVNYPPLEELPDESDAPQVQAPAEGPQEDPGQAESGAPHDDEGETVLGFFKRLVLMRSDAEKED